MGEPERKTLFFVGSSQRDLQGMPEDVKDVFGSALLDAQYGDTPYGARPFGEGLPRQIMKLVDDHDGDTYRAAYTVAFAGGGLCAGRIPEEVEVGRRHAEAREG
jgi:phage-related protein